MFKKLAERKQQVSDKRLRITMKLDFSTVMKEARKQ